MTYKSQTIKETINDIESSKVYLPALQRKFVWNRYQIEMLFDSIMRNFPIGTFLFWKLKNEVADHYVFYEFLKEYDQRNPYNRKWTGAFLNTEITGVLDGQQRLSSIYIGLQGTHTEKVPYMRWADENAFKKATLCLNILSLPYFINDENDIEIDEDKNFEFRFLTPTEKAEWITRKVRYTDEDGNEFVREESMYWFRVGEVLKWKKDPEFDKFIVEFVKHSSNDNQRSEIEHKKRFITRALTSLHSRITTEEAINYFEVHKEDLEDILKIFIRVNSGGTQLSKTDLLFSTIAATWMDGRERIEELLQKINGKGNKFVFTNEFLMRCCLVLIDGPIVFKVNSFKSENVDLIKNQWKDIAKAIENSIDLLVEFGFDGGLLTSQNSTIIIAYYILKGGVIDEETKPQIKKYLIHALLNGIFGSSQDQLLSALRNAFRGEKDSSSGSSSYILKSNHFSFDDLLKVELPSRKSLYITEVELDNFLTYKKGASSFFVLSLLYPQLKFKEVQFHQDHIHPAYGFSPENQQTLGLTNEQWQEWMNLRDMIPNLQLMEGRENESKNAAPFEKWLSSKKDQKHFKVTNFIPDNVSLDFSNFMTFYDNRRLLLKEELRKVLAINDNVQLSGNEYLEQQISFED